MGADETEKAQWASIGQPRISCAVNALRIVLTVVIAGVISGCAGLSPNRPLAPQPTISETTRQALASKKMADFPIYVSENITYYDASKWPEIYKTATEEKKVRRFTRVFPKLSNPPPSTVANANMLVKVFKEYLANNRFKEVDKPCYTCLTLKFDYANYQREYGGRFFFFTQRAPVVFARVRISYRGRTILRGRDDWLTWIQNGVLVPNDVLQYSTAFSIARRVTDDTLQTWNIAILNQHLPLAGRVPKESPSNK